MLIVEFQFPFHCSETGNFVDVKYNSFYKNEVFAIKLTNF